MRIGKCCYYTGLLLSFAVEIWHFFVPALFQWAAYIPDEYANLLVGINWINYFFSLMLTGLSLILLLWSRKVFSGNREAIRLYGFMAFIWLNRVIIAFVQPWPLEPIPWAAYGQTLGAILVFLLQLVGFLSLRAKRPPSPS